MYGENSHQACRCNYSNKYWFEVTALHFLLLWKLHRHETVLTLWCFKQWLRYSNHNNKLKSWTKWNLLSSSKTPTFKKQSGLRLRIKCYRCIKTNRNCDGSRHMYILNNFYKYLTNWSCVWKNEQVARKYVWKIFLSCQGLF